MTKENLKELCDLALKPGSCSYNALNKEAFRYLSKKLLFELIKRLKLKKEDYDIRYSAGGDAVGGDVSLHTETLYVVVSPDTSDLGILYRSCDGIKDYCGGRNHWFSYKKLNEEGIDSLREAVENVE